MCKQLKKHKKAILFVTIKIKIVDIKMPRKYSFAYRRSNPGQFPYVCDTCVPQRRFLLPLDQKRHEQSRRHHNGILKAATSSFSAYSAPRSLPKFDFSASSSSLSSVTESNLNIFVLNEIEPDTAYNQSCRAVVDRLCQFMQNNFPGQLRPSEVRKVNQAIVAVLFRLSLFLYLSVCLFVCLSLLMSV